MDPYSHHPYTTHYPSQNPNPNPSPNLSIEPYKPLEPQYSIALDTGLRPPGVEPNLAFGLGSVHGYEAHQPGVVYSNHQTVDVSVPSSYYQDPNSIAAAQNWAVAQCATVVDPSLYYQDPNSIAAVQNWVATEVGSQYAAISYPINVAVPPNGTQQLVPAYPNSALWNNATVQPHKKVLWKKGPKKMKIVQSAWCEVCRIDCNSKDVLEQHKMGKKHIKNLEKLKARTAPPPVASSQSNNPLIGPQENPDKGKTVSGQKTKKAAEPVEDLETKKRKVLESGADAESVRTCALCNVVCNSVTVFKFHLIGQKHASMMKKYAAGTGSATST